MNIGKRIRLNRIFAHPSGRLCSVAVDHFIGYGQGLPDRAAAHPAHAGGDCVGGPGRRDDAQGHRQLGLAALCRPGSADPAEHDGAAGRFGPRADRHAGGRGAAGRRRLCRGRLRPRRDRGGAPAGRGRLRPRGGPVRAAGICHIYPRDPKTRQIVFHARRHRLGGALRGRVRARTWSRRRIAATCGLRPDRGRLRRCRWWPPAARSQYAPGSRCR